MRFVFILACSLLTSLGAWAKPTAVIIKETTAYGQISYPQISGLANKGVEQSVNKLISDMVATWTCDEDDGASAQKYYNASTKLRLIDSSYLSFTTDMDSFCGGAYPNNYMTSANFDLKTGRAISLDDLLVPEMDGESLTRFLVTGHKFVTSCKDDDGGDDMTEIYSPDSMENLWGYYRTKSQIVFIPDLPHVVQACFEEFPMPVERMKAYLR